MIIYYVLRLLRIIFNNKYNLEKNARQRKSARVMAAMQGHNKQYRFILAVFINTFVRMNVHCALKHLS